MSTARPSRPPAPSPVPRRVALTGATGLNGSHTAHALARAGHRVRALVRPGSQRAPVADCVSDWVIGSLADADALQHLVTGADAVIHCALDWDLQAREELPDIERNLMGSLRLLETARLAGVPQFIFVSSAAAARVVAVPAQGRVDETAAAWPTCPYGAYKASVEAYLKVYHACYAMNTSAWRPAAVYGLHPVLERSLWFDLLQRARRGEMPDDKRVGGVTAVTDVADALTLAVGDGAIAGEVVDLTELTLSWKTVVRIAQRRVQSPSDVELEVASPAYGSSVDISKALAFFHRHGHPTALRGGLAGVEAYVRALMDQLSE